MTLEREKVCMDAINSASAELVSRIIAPGDYLLV